MSGESREGDVGHGLRGWTPRPRRHVPGAVLPPAPAPKTCAQVFRGLSAWVANLDDFPPDYALPLLQRNGFQSIVVKVAHGNTGVAVDYGRLAIYRDAGLQLLSWSWCDADGPFTQGVLAASLLQLGFVGHWANAEKLYDLTSPGGSQDPVAFGRSKEWLAGWEAAGGHTVPLGVSPEPFSGIDHEAWQDAGAAYGPQAYTAENGANVGTVEAWGVMRGWQSGQIVPLIEPRFQGRETAAVEYARSAKLLGLPGLVLYPADQLLDRPDIWDQIGGAWR